MSAPTFTESARLAAVQSPVIPVVAELIRRHPGTISLGQGVVRYGPPMVDVGARLAEFSRDAENHKYQPVHGIAPLVAAFEAKLRNEHGVSIKNIESPDSGRRIVVTAGGNMAFVNAVLAVACPGDEVILPTPFYFNHEMAVAIAGCKPVRVPTDPDTYQLNVPAIAAAITPRTRAVVTISPNNPTGVVYPESTIRAVNDLCRTRGIFHIHDEAYEYFTWAGARHFSPASIAGGERHTICLYSLSKSYGFASWRIGSMLIPAHLFDAVRKIQDTILICPPVVSQYAALGALDAGPAYVREHLAAIEEVRSIVLDELSTLGDRVRLTRADGAFYVFLRVNRRPGDPAGMTSMQLVERLIQDHGVAVLPGSTFGALDAEACTIRISYGSLRKECVIEGIGRLVSGLRTLA